MWGRGRPVGLHPTDWIRGRICGMSSCSNVLTVMSAHPPVVAVTSRKNVIIHMRMN